MVTVMAILLIVGMVVWSYVMLIWQDDTKKTPAREYLDEREGRDV